MIVYHGFINYKFLNSNAYCIPVLISWLTGLEHNFDNKQYIGNS